MAMRSGWRLCGVLFAGLALLLAGCTTTAHQDFLGRRYAQAMPKFQALRVAGEHRDYALHELDTGGAYFEAGDSFDAAPCFRNAAKVMARVQEKGEVAAVVGSETWKVFKGDPFEKMMAHFFTGIRFYRLAQTSQSKDDRVVLLEDALGAFRRALEADKDSASKKQIVKENFALGHYMTARCYAALGEESNAQVHLNKALACVPGCPYFTMESLTDHNFIVVTACGYGPLKTRTGPGESIMQLVPRAGAETTCTLSVDSAPVGSIVQVDDLFQQANEVDWGTMDKVRLGKGVAKELISAIPFAGIAAHAVMSEADIRVWQTLPGRMLLWTGKVEPGLHTLELAFTGGSKNAPLDRYRQIWYSIPAMADETTVLYLRSGYDRHNMANIVTVPLVGEMPEGSQ